MTLSRQMFGARHPRFRGSRPVEKVSRCRSSSRPGFRLLPDFGCLGERDVSSRSFARSRIRSGPIPLASNSSPGITPNARRVSPQRNALQGRNALHVYLPRDRPMPQEQVDAPVLPKRCASFRSRCILSTESSGRRGSSPVESKSKLPRAAFFRPEPRPRPASAQPCAMREMQPQAPVWRPRRRMRAARSFRMT